jgi:ribonuclease-3
LPVYALLSESGEDHAKTFLVACTLQQPPLVTQGEGGSRRAAEQVAAEAALQALGAA